MNRLSCLQIGALILAIGAGGCFGSTTSDETTSKRDRERAPQLVSPSSDGSESENVPSVVHSHTDPATEAMGPQPEPWTGRAAAQGDNGGPQPEPWTGNEDESNGTQGPRPNPNPIK